MDLLPLDVITGACTARSSARPQTVCWQEETSGLDVLRRLTNSEVPKY